MSIVNILTQESRRTMAWGPQLARALAYATHMESLLVLAMLALLVGVVERVAALPAATAPWAAVSARLFESGYLYLVMRKAATGSRRLPRLADYRDTWYALILPLLQATVVGLWFWGPVLYCASRTFGLDDFTRRLQLRGIELFRRTRWCTSLLLLGELIYVPAALTVVAGSSAILIHMDPTLGLRRVHRTGADYESMFWAFQVLVVLAFVAHTVATLLQQALPIPLAAPVMGHLLSGWVGLAQARLLGDFYYRHARELAE